jgi:hypothetical protein
MLSIGEAAQQKPEKNNMDLVGYNDLQARSAYQPTIHRQGSRWIAYVGHHGGAQMNTLTGKQEPNGTSIVDVTDPKQPRYMAHIPGEPQSAAPGESGGAQMTRVCDGSQLPRADRLPADVRARCVWRESYWLTAEALSTYRRSAGLFGHEMHSPILCIGQGIPAIVCRWAEQTSKGIMWRDIGLGDWLFDLDKEDELARVADTVLAMAKNPAGAKAKAAKAREFVQQRQRETMAVLRKEVFK